MVKVWILKADVENKIVILIKCKCGVAAGSWWSDGSHVLCVSCKLCLKMRRFIIRPCYCELFMFPGDLYFNNTIWISLLLTRLSEKHAFTGRIFHLNISGAPTIRHFYRLDAITIEHQKARLIQTRLFADPCINSETDPSRWNI